MSTTYISRMLRVARGKCMNCRLPRINALFCADHAKRHRDKERVRQQEKRERAVAIAALGTDEIIEIEASHAP